MKVLVIQQKMIGDVLTSTIICESLKMNYPDCTVHYMVHPNTIAVIEHHPHIDNIVIFDPKLHKGFQKLKVFGQSLKNEKYDVVIDAYGKWESIIPAYFCGAKTRIGFKKWYTSLLYTTTVIQKPNVSGSSIVHRIQLVEALLQKEIAWTYPKIYLADNEIDTAKISLKPYLNTQLKTIMISVLGSDLNKSLPFEYMAKTIDVIAKENVQLLFNFMPNQLEDAKRIYSLCQKESQQKIIFDFEIKGLREFLSVLSQCDALIGNEGGAVNMAKALGVKTFSIYSPWINKLSWNALDDGINNATVHLIDYFPEIYDGKHPKNFKSQAFELYKKLTPELYQDKLEKFVKHIVD